VINFFSSAVTFLSLRRTADEGGLPTVGITRLVLVAGTVFDVDATEASLSFEDSPGDALRFLRFLRGLPFNFGAENQRQTRRLGFIQILRLGQLTEPSFYLVATCERAFVSRLCPDLDARLKVNACQRYIRDV